MRYFGGFVFFFCRKVDWSAVVVDEAVLGAGPADVLFVICPCEVVPIGDIKVLDSWVYYFPMTGGEWFSFVGSWLDYMPRSCGRWGNEGF